MARIKKNDLEKAIKEKAGLITFIASGLNVTRDAVYKAIERYKLEGKLDEARDSTLDLAESQLFNALRDGDKQSVQFYLKTIGRKRGYVEKQEVEHMGDILIELEDHNDIKKTKPAERPDSSPAKSEKVS